MLRKEVLSRAPRRSLLADICPPSCADTIETSKTRAVLQLRAAPCFEEQLHPACNRSTVSTGRGASHSTTCIPGGITRGHRGDVLQTSRQWLRQDATEFRTQTNVHGAQKIGEAFR